MSGDFPDGPVVKTSPSNAGVEGLIPSLGAKIPHVSWPKHQNIKHKQKQTNPEVMQGWEEFVSPRTRVQKHHNMLSLGYNLQKECALLGR